MERIAFILLVQAITIGMVWFYAMVFNPDPDTSMVWFIALLMSMIEGGLAQISWHQENK